MSRDRVAAAASDAAATAANRVTVAHGSKVSPTSSSDRVQRAAAVSGSRA